MDPIKCFSCGKTMKHPEGGMVAVRNMTKDCKENFFRQHHIKRLCCKRMYLSAVNYNDILLMYEGARSTLNVDGTIKKPFS
jgi:DNA-directed RNA polymerase subunit N (RpoN/RPB10)